MVTLITIVLVSNAQLSNAQNGYKKGDNLLNVGIGVNSYYSSGIPFGASYEIGITDDISVGANIDYLSSSYSAYGSSENFSAFYIGGRGSYHFNKLLRIEGDKLDLYAGAALGYRSFSWSDNKTPYGLDNSYGSSIYIGAFIGGKYYFSDKIGAFVELGEIGSTNARVGIAFKF